MKAGLGLVVFKLNKCQGGEKPFPYTGKFIKPPQLVCTIRVRYCAFLDKSIKPGKLGDLQGQGTALAL